MLVFNNDYLTISIMMLNQVVIKALLKVASLKGLILVPFRFEVRQQRGVQNHETRMRERMFLAELEDS